MTVTQLFNSVEISALRVLCGYDKLPCLERYYKSIYYLVSQLDLSHVVFSVITLTSCSRLCRPTSHHVTPGYGVTAAHVELHKLRIFCSKIYTSIWWWWSPSLSSSLSSSFFAFRRVNIVNNRANKKMFPLHRLNLLAPELFF